MATTLRKQKESEAKVRKDVLKKAPKTKPAKPKRKPSGPTALDLTPCQIATAAYNAAVTVAAQKLIAKENAQVVLDTKSAEYETAFGVAMEAYSTMFAECGV